MEKSITPEQIKKLLEAKKLERQDYGARFNDGKLEWTLVDFDAFNPMVRVLMFGAKKYAAHNWKKGFRYTDILNSMQRHINAFLAGENNDPESGLPHIGHIQCNAMFLGYMVQFRKDMDDRFIDQNKPFHLEVKQNGGLMQLKLSLEENSHS